MTFEVEFYMKTNGRIPVQDFLYSLEPKLRAKAFKEIELLHGFVKKLWQRQGKK